MSHTGWWGIISVVRSGQMRHHIFIEDNRSMGVQKVNFSHTGGEHGHLHNGVCLWVFDILN